ncbi:hypothetical protein Deval_2043 [Nitratidesulfovibrio vulgaris RCH1]|nr:hypothetical protein Deval_2043 [Nitratidesulfovibrio vulgaris RCH1]
MLSRFNRWMDDRGYAWLFLACCIAAALLWGMP